MPDPTDVDALVAGLVYEIMHPTCPPNWNSSARRDIVIEEVRRKSVNRLAGLARKADDEAWRPTRDGRAARIIREMEAKAEQLERERDEAREAVVAAQDYINDILGCPSPDFIATVVAREAVKGAK